MLNLNNISNKEKRNTMSDYKFALINIVMLYCFVVIWNFGVSQAKPLDILGGVDKMVPSAKFLQALANKYSNSPYAGKLQSRPNVALYPMVYPSSQKYSIDENVDGRQANIKENDNLQYSPLEYLQSLTDYENNNNNNNNDDYYQYQTDSDGLYYGDGQDGWFNGPIVPKVDQTKEDTLNDPLNKLLLNYLYDHYNKLYDNDEEDDDSNIQKRRHKVVIKDDIELTSPHSLVSSTSGQRKPKVVYKPVYKEGNHHLGQKEVPLLRPTENKQNDWPSELEENNLEVNLFCICR